MSFKFQEVKITTILSFFLGYIYGEITNPKNSPTKVGIHLVFSWEIEKIFSHIFLPIRISKKTENYCLNTRT